MNDSPRKAILTKLDDYLKTNPASDYLRATQLKFGH